MNHYEVLRVSKKAGPNEIKKAYRKRAKEFHPDRNPDRETVELFRKIKEAYRILSDPIERKKYDGQQVNRVTAEPLSFLQGYWKNFLQGEKK